MERADLDRGHGGHSHGILNDERRTVLQCAQMYDLAICNTFFQKEDEHLKTYRSGHDSQRLITSWYEDRV